MNECKTILYLGKLNKISVSNRNISGCKKRLLQVLQVHSSRCVDNISSSLPFTISNLRTNYVSQPAVHRPPIEITTLPIQYEYTQTIKNGDSFVAKKLFAKGANRTWSKYKIFQTNCIEICSFKSSLYNSKIPITYAYT